MDSSTEPELLWIQALNRSYCGFKVLYGGGETILEGTELGMYIVFFTLTKTMKMEAKLFSPPYYI